MESNLLSMSQEFSGLPMDALIGGPLNAAAKANAAMALTQTKFMLDTCFSKLSVGEQQALPYRAASIVGGLIVPEQIASPAIPAHDSYEPVMIVMSLQRSVITPAVAAVAADPNATPPVLAKEGSDLQIQNFTTKFNLPMLTIVPLNSLAVSTVDINFEMEVKSSFSEEQSQTKTTEIKGESSFEAKAQFGPFSVTIRGSASYDSKDSATHNTHYEKSNSAKYSVNVHAAQLPLPKGVNTIIEAFSQSISPLVIGGAPATT